MSRQTAGAPSRFYDFTATSIDGEEVAMADYRGQAVVVVNTASRCGFTPQYDGLEALYRAHRDEGLVVLGFPCNQFKGQEPGSEEEIASFCRLDHGVTFPLFAKVEVNGPGTHPLWAWLKAQRPGTLGEAVKWNFTKFLVGRDGQVIARYAPTTTPEKMEADVLAALDVPRPGADR